MATSNGISNRATVGFAKSAAYDQYRPAYSDTITQLLLEKLGVVGKKGARIVDLAAGTGKFTESLARRDEKYEIIAIEPHDRMREVLAEKKLLGVTVKDGKAENVPLEDESVDAVICAQSFHWFASLPSLREIHRILQSHGALGMVWNIDDFNSPEHYQAATTWERKAHDILWTFSDEVPRYRHEKWREVFDQQLGSGPMALITAGDQLFSLPLGEDVEKYEIQLSKEGCWERFNTISHISVLEGVEREKTYKTFMDALNSPEVETDSNGEVTLHGNTIAVWTTKIPAEGRAGLTEVEKPT